jgi:hypothetical protein
MGSEGTELQRLAPLLLNQKRTTEVYTAHETCPTTTVDYEELRFFPFPERYWTRAFFCVKYSTASHRHLLIDPYSCRKILDRSLLFFSFSFTLPVQRLIGIK